MKWLGIFGMLIATTYAQADFMVIAHRGACGYVPEHTAVASAMAHAMQADYIEQDVAFTKDGVPLVIHDVVLDTTTNVAAVFPDRARPDGRWYVIDFTAAEIAQLNKGERFDVATGTAVFPQRYPAGRFEFPLLFLDEAVAFIAGMDRSTGRRTGLYPELKRPEFHLANGLDPVPPFMAALQRSGALDGPLPVHIQCFHSGTLQRIRAEYGKGLTLIQLIGENDWKESSDDYTAMRSADGLAKVATYADGIGLPLERILHVVDGQLQWLPLLSHARNLGLKIHPYTVRRESLPAGISLQQLMAFLAAEGGVDGVFTDFPDQH